MPAEATTVDCTVTFNERSEEFNVPSVAALKNAIFKEFGIPLNQQRITCESSSNFHILFTFRQKRLGFIDSHLR